MLIGSGKTQTAHELQRRLQRAHVVDPEPLGLALQKMLPATGYMRAPGWQDESWALQQIDRCVHVLDEER
jgi:hypothetical protein